jgi:RHS repeat-associated protein
MRTALGSAARLFLVGAILLGPGGVNAADLGTTTVAGASLTAQKVNQTPQVNSCNVGKTDPISGVMSALAQLFGLGPGSPAIFASPVFHGANRNPSPWGRGWSSDLDHFLIAGSGNTLTWQDGLGNKLAFLRNNASNTLPISLTSPAGEFSDLKITAVSSQGTPTSVELRDTDGTVRLFSVAESSSVLRLSRLTDRNGNTVDYIRGSQGRLTRAQDIHGRFITVTYTAAGLVRTLTDSGGSTATYTYDSLGRRTSETGPAGTTAYQYDSADRMIKVTFPNGGVRNYIYDSQDRVTSQDDGDGQNRMTYIYESTRTIETNALGYQTSYEFIERQGLRKIRKIVDPGGGIMQFEYDSNFNLASITDPLGRTIRYAFDSKGNITAMQDAQGNQTSASYEQNFNQVVSVTDPRNHISNLSYDAKGNLTRVVDPADQQTLFVYDNFGHVVEAKDATNQTTHFSYSASNGSLTSATNPLNQTFRFETNARSQVTRIVDPAGRETSYNYDASGTLVNETDALGGVTGFDFVSGRSGKLSSRIINANNHATSLQYDNADRLTRITNSQGQAISTRYDANGRPISILTRRAQEIRLVYDSSDRLTQISTPEGPVSLAYDNADNLVATNNSNSATTWAYDSLDRIASANQVLPNGFNVPIAHTFDANGNRTSMTTPWGTFAFTYDALNRIIGINNPFGQTVTFAYDSLSRRTSMTLPNGTNSLYSYNSAGQIAQITHQVSSSSVPIAFANYTYDANSNRIGMSDKHGVHTYGYDALHHLTRADHAPESTLPIKGETFSYDALGNRTSDATRSNYLYNTADRPASDSMYIYTTDANGNITSRAAQGSGAISTYSYDSANRLVAVSTAPGATATYKYDARGNRIEKNLRGVITRYVYDGDNILAALDANNTLIQLFTHGPGIDTPLIVRSSGIDYFYHADALGSPLALTNSQGQAVEDYEYQAFGHPQIRDSEGGLHSESTVGNVYLYAGREFDSETGFYYLRRRHYDPDSGRFLQEDPIGLAGGINLYAYANSNPLIFVDPYGTEFQIVIGPSLLIGGIFPPLTPFIGGGGAIGFTTSGKIIFQGSVNGEIGSGLGVFFGLQGGISYSPQDTPTGISITRDKVLDANLGNGVTGVGISLQKGESGTSIAKGILPRIGYGAGAQVSVGKKRTVTIASPSLFPLIKEIIELSSKHEIMCKI